MTDTELLELFDKRIKRNPAMVTVLGVVKSVDENEMTCVIDDDGFDIQEVRLRPVLDNKKSMTIFPKVGAWAIAIRIEDGEEWMLIHAGEIDKYRIEQNSLVFEMDGQKFLIKKGESSLIDILKSIIEATQQIMVLYGNNPDYTKLSQALQKTEDLLK